MSNYLLSRPIDYSIIDDRPYTIQEVADRLACSPETVTRLINNNEILAFRVKTAWKVLGAEIVKYRDSNKSTVILK